MDIVITQQHGEHSMPSPPVLLKVRSADWFITAVVIMAVFTIVPFIPTILNSRIGVAEKDIQLWNAALIGVYGGAVFLASPIFGYFADRNGSRRIPLLLGFIALAGATIMLHVGNTIALLITARVLQGLAAAAVYSVGFALLFDTVGLGGIGKALGWLSPAMIAGSFLGPTIGGLLYDAGGDSAVFGFSYGIIAIDIILRLVVIEKDTAKQWKLKRSDSGYGTISPSPPGSAGGIEPSNNGRPTSPAKSSMFRLLTIPRLLVATFGWLVIGGFLTAFDGVLPIFVQGVFGWSATGAGLIFLPLFLPSLIGSPLAGRAVDSMRNSTRILTATGFIICLPFFVLLRLVEDNSTQSLILLCVFLAMIGIGSGLCGPPLAKEISQVVESVELAHPGVFGPKGATAQAYGLYNSAFALGNLIGPILAGTLTTLYGWATMAWVFGLISGVTGIIMALFLEGWVGSSSLTNHNSEEVEPLISGE
ncbi:MFS transporter [Sclerotinia borealis F-4128]|uniref:MFS transporter n=1 Tax=Sclerotinia borealis (strain F-4128) TaxID=1432307 RepID=W9CHY5_SCLBF|nr:MFS transporter [Sclerotinia borealis F-4128]